MKTYGTPLKNTHPAQVEKYIVDKIRVDIGMDLLDKVKIQPKLEVDREEGDLSGNLSNGYGTIQLTVGDQSVFIPFIITNRELLPFEVIRMGTQEAGYSPEKLRNVIRNLAQRSAADETEGDVISRDDVPFDNGFLGTIMDVRDEENMKSMNGANAWRGSSFGDLDEARMMKRRADVDVFDVLEKVAMITQQATIITPQDLETFLDKVAADASNVERPNVFDKTAAYEEQKALRLSEKLDDIKLVNYAKHRSGNNVSLPLTTATGNGQRFETTRGRIYTKFTSAIGSRPSFKGLVVTAGQKFRILKDSDQLMTFRDAEVASFEPKDVGARSFAINRLYTYEENDTTAVIPFRIKDSFVRSHRDRFTVGQRSTSVSDALSDTNTLFQDVLVAQEYDKVAPKSFGILLTNLVTVPTRYKRNELIAFIDDHAASEDDNWLAKAMVSTYQLSEYVLMPPHKRWIEMIYPLEGGYTKPNSIVPRDVLEKQAAFKDQNVATLRVKGMQKPRVYSIDWQYVEAVGAGGARTERIKKAYENKLTYEKARNMLLLLGFTHMQTQQLFDMVHRSSRQASLPLPDVKKAKELSRDEMGRKQKLERKQSILSQTLNHQVLGKELSNLMSFGIAAALDTAGLTDPSAGIHAFMKQSQETAVALEKLAEAFKGEHWAELAVIANVKHRIDKVASEIHQGKLVADADDLFKVAGELTPKIEKLAKLLVPYNRLQNKLETHHRIDSDLIKQAQTMLDMMYGYAGLDKTAGVQSFFGDAKTQALGLAALGKDKLTQIVDPYGAAMSQATQETEDAYRSYQAAALKQAMGEPVDLAITQEALRAAHGGQLDVRLKQVAHDDRLRGGTALGLSGVALPGLAGMIGYQSGKDEGDATVQ